MYRNLPKETLDHLIDALRPTCVPKVDQVGPMLLFVLRDMVRVFRPRVKMRWGSHMLDGDFGLFLELPTQKLDNQSRIPMPDSLSLTPMMDYPAIVKASAIKNDRVSDELIRLIALQLSKLPDTAEGVRVTLGNDFLGKTMVERCVVLTRYLRSADS